MTNFRPTRTTPHRLCRPLHAVSAVAGLLALSVLAPVQPWVLGLLGVSILFAIGLHWLVHRQSMTDSAREALDDTVTVTSRPGWALAAVIADAVTALFALTLCAVLLADRNAATWAAAPAASGRGLFLTSLAGALGFSLLSEVLHRRAVHIAKGN